MARINPAEPDAWLQTRVLGQRRHYRRGTPQETATVIPPIVPPPTPSPTEGVQVFFDPSTDEMVYVYPSDPGGDEIVMPVGSLMVPDPADPDIMMFQNTPTYIP
jgi:hypothetical protein